MAGRANRTTHVQQQLRWANAAGDLRGRKREASGANRRGKKRLGRPKKSGAKQRHAKRPVFAKRQALHVTLRIEREVGSLRKRACYAAIRRAAITVLAHEDCRIVHLSIQRTHLHLIVEAETSAALSTGMQALQISAAKHLNAAVSRAGSWWERRQMAAPPARRKGRVFADRYHQRVITSPLQARREIAYVLNNWRKHGEDRTADARRWQIDPFATGWCFDGWRERGDAPFAWKVRDTYDPIPVWLPRTWLLREGWRRHGAISTHEVPSARPTA
ncbi:MAG: transposase [Deltaproteobacteria bacterium]|nr:transposase [Deltaproteobacteria bacterium]